MSYISHADPECTPGDSFIRLRIKPRKKDLGEFSVRRVLPSSEQEMVGPFVFFDQMGPATFQPGHGIDVRPHPHIGIATITYLFKGEILHRDSLGVVQAIQPGAVNLMTAGKGISHAERPGEDFDRESELFGIQSWIALPDELQEIDPDFAHFTKDSLPTWRENGVVFRLIMGDFTGRSSPVSQYSKTLYLDLSLDSLGEAALPIEEKEAALYVAEGAIRLNEEPVEAGVMVVVDPTQDLSISSAEGARVLLIGGDPVGKRHLYWNFVSNSKDRIDQAKADWKAKRFPPVPGDDEFIPLPE
ncbi:MAG: pirin family protein [Pseudomonadota bacterium]